MSTRTGKKAEKKAADFLKSQRFKILDMNWKRPSCEIDIIAAKKRKTSSFRAENIIHFIEVKYRRRNRQGSGFDYITSTKLNQMMYAAEMWVTENHWQGGYELSAMEVSGDSFKVRNLIEKLDI